MLESQVLAVNDRIILLWLSSLILVLLPFTENVEIVLGLVLAVGNNNNYNLTQRL